MNSLRFVKSKVGLIAVFLQVFLGPYLLAQKEDVISYKDNALSINDSGFIIKGASEIVAAHLNKGLIRKNYEPSFGVVANRDSSYYYEIGSYHDAKGVKYGFVMVWDISGEERKAELEFYAKYLDHQPALVEIDKRRKEWVQLCNAHDARTLINELYAENTMYYNHKPLVVGRSGLIQDYQYMNNERYSLDLTPLKTEQISDRIALEIGQCSGSYNGKYIIVWQKGSSGKWLVLLDSNI